MSADLLMVAKISPNFLPQIYLNVKFIVSSLHDFTLQIMCSQVGLVGKKHIVCQF